MTMRLLVRVPPCRPISELVDVGQRVESVGFTGISFPDSPMLWRDAWCVLTAVAAQTTSLGLQLAVTNPMSRHASVTASAARAVDEIAPGRLTVCVGIGDSAVHFAGLRRATNAQLADYVTSVRTLLSGGEVGTDSGHPMRLRDARPVPVLVGASGPRNLSLAGSHADGALLPGVDWEHDVDLVRQAAEENGRDPDALRYVMTRTCIITDQPERDARVLKPFCVRLAQVGAGPMFAAAGFPIEAPPHDIDAPYGDLGHPEDLDEAVRVSSQWVSDEAALWFARTRCLFGSAEEVVTQIRDLEAAGVRELMVSHVGAFTLPEQLIEAFADQVLPSLGDLIG